METGCQKGVVSGLLNASTFSFADVVVGEEAPPAHFNVVCRLSNFFLGADVYSLLKEAEKRSLKIERAAPVAVYVFFWYIFRTRDCSGGDAAAQLHGTRACFGAHNLENFVSRARNALVRQCPRLVEAEAEPQADGDD